MEFLVEAVAGRLVMQYFMGRYPQATFTEHPTMNGFYVRCRYLTMTIQIG
jgi:hypothetical protein